MNTSYIGLYLDLDETSKAYELMYEKTHWTDAKYQTSDGGWDEEKYYSDFDKWWINLMEEQRFYILKKIGYKP